MSNRITGSMIETLINRLNVAAGIVDVKYNTVGSYQAYYAYGGVAIVKITGSAGSCTTIIQRRPKRETFNCLNSYINGYLANKGGKQKCQNVQTKHNK